LRLRQLALTIGGWSLILVGVAGLLLPVVPGIVFLTAGLAILPSRSAWARRILELGCVKNLTARKWLAYFHSHLGSSPAKPETASFFRD